MEGGGRCVHVTRESKWEYKSFKFVIETDQKL